jgi:hypothetical protein
MSDDLVLALNICADSLEMPPSVQSIRNINAINTMHEAASTITQLRADLASYEEALKDTRRLAREIDVALHGEDGAAKQASLCDLVHPAAKLRAALAKAEQAAAEATARAVRVPIEVKPRVNWRDDPDAIVEDDNPDVRGDAE